MAFEGSDWDVSTLFRRSMRVRKGPKGPEGPKGPKGPTSSAGGLSGLELSGVR